MTAPQSILTISFIFIAHACLEHYAPECVSKSPSKGRREFSSRLTLVDVSDDAVHLENRNEVINVNLSDYGHAGSVAQVPTKRC